MFTANKPEFQSLFTDAHFTMRLPACSTNCQIKPCAAVHKQISVHTKATRLVSVYTHPYSASRAGVCYRLWGQQDHDQLLPCTLHEIASADLAPLALQLASWGSPDGEGLAWLDPPEPQALADARQLLLELAAVDEKGSLTATGRRMAALPAHPRFAHMVLRAQQLGFAELGCLLAALLSERDLFRGSSSSGRGGSSGTDPGADLTTRLKVLAGAGVTRLVHSAFLQMHHKLCAASAC
jgi:HrpA-like RNA helicase